MAGIVIFLLIRVKMLLYFLYGTYRNGNSYKFTPFLRIYAFGNVCNGFKIGRASCRERVSSPV